MALLDEGETDWKVIVIDINDPLASKLNGKKKKKLYKMLLGIHLLTDVIQ
jgi:inorganic pyrophosphatase